MLHSYFFLVTFPQWVWHIWESLYMYSALQRLWTLQSYSHSSSCNCRHLWEVDDGTYVQLPNSASGI